MNAPKKVNLAETFPLELWSHYNFFVVDQIFCHLTYEIAIGQQEISLLEIQKSLSSSLQWMKKDLSSERIEKYASQVLEGLESFHKEYILFLEKMGLESRRDIFKKIKDCLDTIYSPEFDEYESFNPFTSYPRTGFRQTQFTWIIDL